MQKTLAEHPGWQQSAQQMASEFTSNSNGLTWQPFPDPNDSLHCTIWETACKNKEIGDGYGIVCDYYGLDLVIVSDVAVPERTSSFFYVPAFDYILGGDEPTAFTRYLGPREATLTNVITLIQHVAAVKGHPVFVVNDANDIPHSKYQMDNPGLTFNEMLSARGITISPPVYLDKNVDTLGNNYGEYNLYVYMPCGGRLFRYQVRCLGGQFYNVNSYFIGADIGDCWYLR